MKNEGRKLLSVLLTLLMVLTMITPVLADTAPVEAFAYDGEDVSFIKDDGAAFGMFARQEGTTVYLIGDDVVIHYVTKSNVRSSDQSLVYTSLHWGAVTDELTRDVPANADGTFDITLPAENCGKALPVAPVKPDGGTTSAQYYLAIPAADKLTEIPELEDGTYQLPELAAGPSAMFNHFVAESRQLVVEGETATVRFITDGSTASIQKYSRIARGKSRVLVTTAYQPELAEGVTVIDGVLQPADDSGTDKYLFEVTLPKNDAAVLLANDTPEDIYIVVWNNKGAASNGNVPGWYLPSNDIYLSLGALGEKVEEPVPVEYDRSFTVTVDGTALDSADFVLRQNGYSYVDYATQATLTADTYVVTVPQGTEKVTLSFPENRLAYNYTKGGEYLGGYYEDFMTGALTAEVPLDYGSDTTPADGEMDYIQVQTPYDADYNSVLLFTITFRIEGEPEVTELEITNNTGMFKAVTASLETLDGNTTLVMALSGSGYGNLFKGTDEEAAANGAQTENWIVGELNADGKLEFRIPVAEG